MHLAWQRARDAAGYRFATDLVQVTFPAHTLAAAGSAADHTELHLEGAIDAQAETLDLKLWQGGGSVASPGAAPRCGSQAASAYSRRLDGSSSWEEVPDFSGSFAPGSDALAFLAGFKNLQELTPLRVSFGGGSPCVSVRRRADYRRFSFSRRPCPGRLPAATASSSNCATRPSCRRA